MEDWKDGRVEDWKERRVTRQLVGAASCRDSLNSYVGWAPPTIP